ncbi:MAG: hypothetical protein C0412_04005 [Flavobacterium sp.]|nr:hypothetical protein [Flavobacterium sp.]
MREVIILTGKIGSGKTTSLFNWVKNNKNIAGIVTVTNNGKRILWDVASNNEIIFEVDESFNGPVQRIGQFIFDEEAFTWAENHINNYDFDYVDSFVLDEAGLLELNKKGFYNAIQNLLLLTQDKEIKIIFVVREQCVDKFIELFNLKNIFICTKEDFNSSFLILNSSLIEYTAYILCGGKSTRFGTDKALVELNGKKIVEIIADELKKVFSKIVLVTPDAPKYEFLKMECINDVYTGCGPLAGIHTALKHSETEKIFVISCDMPLMKADIIKYIAEYQTDKKIIIPKAGDKKQYLCAVYNKNMLPEVEKLLEQTKNLPKCASPYDLINLTGYELIDFDTLGIFDIKCFFNLNTKEDLEKLRY